MATRGPDADLPARIAAKAAELGFDLCGISSARPSEKADYWADWLASGKAGDMRFLSERLDERLDPGVYFPGAKSAVCVGINYYVDLEAVPPEQKVPGRIARYALAPDYHATIKRRLFDLADWLREQDVNCMTRCGVDTAPIPERELAARAGIGWVGKNTCVINPKIGSFIFLGVVLTTLDLAPSPAETDHCGTCTACLDACPTSALTPYSLDAAQCISYLTIEHQGEIAAGLAAKMGDWLYGCDICQDVCPHNRKAVQTADPRFLPRFPSGTIDAAAVAQWTLADYHVAVRHSAMKRVKLDQFRRNAAIVLGNAREKSEDAPA